MNEQNEAMKKALGIEHMPEAEQKEILGKVNKRLESVVLDVIVANLSDEEAKTMREALASGVNIEDEVATITAAVPSLAEKIEKAVQDEIERFRQVLNA
jgi:hypothetical protein